MRIGWDGFSRNYRDIALMIEDSGASMISVHGRTREEGYGGIADWDAIAEVKSMVRIPVIGSGDVSSRLDAENRIAQFGVDGVLVGRAAMGNPWIFSGIRRSTLPREQITSVIKEHFLDMLTFYGDHAVILFRKHATRYAAEFPQHERLALLSCETPSEFLDRLEECAQAEKLEATAIA
jgi:tRNA-dihydrouridine synthase